MIAGLPYDAEVEYLESTGTQYIVLGDVLMGKTFVVEGKWCPLETTNDRFIFGGGQHSVPLYSRTGVYGASNPFLLPSGESVNILQQGAIYIYERVDREYVVFRSYAMSSDYVFLFAQEWGNVPAGKITARLFYLRVSVNDEVAMDLIPVRFTNEQNQSEGAMYDRVSRKLFRNAGTGAFTIGPDVATPVMGLHFMPKPVLSARNYVQDGLIAMWDGIENAGWGTHDPNATTWKDLSGNGFDLTVDQGSVVWHENYVDPVDANAANHVYRENAQSEMGALGVAPVTVEAVFYNPYKNDFRVLSCLTYQNRYNAFVGYYNTFGLGGALRDVPKGAVLACSASLTSTLVNGNDAGAVVFTNNLSSYGRSDKDISMFGCRNTNGNAGYTTICSLYTLRVYASDLTTSDRIANYAVDKERFNLP